MNRIEVPQRGVHTVVHRSLARARKLVGQHALAYEARKRSQNAARYRRPSGGQAQSGKCDHDVASPVVEPRISGQDSFRIRNAIHRSRRDELVRRQRKLLHGQRRKRSRFAIDREKLIEKRARFPLAIGKRGFAISEGAARCSRQWSAILPARSWRETPPRKNGRCGQEGRERVRRRDRNCDTIPGGR